MRDSDKDDVFDDSFDGDDNWSNSRIHLAEVHHFDEAHGNPDTKEAVSNHNK